MKTWVKVAIGAGAVYALYQLSIFYCFMSRGEGLFCSSVKKVASFEPTTYNNPYTGVSTVLRKGNAQDVANAIKGLPVADARYQIMVKGFEPRICDTPAGSKIACAWDKANKPNRISVNATNGRVVSAFVG